MEQRKKQHSILLDINSKVTPVGLYDAEQWPEQTCAPGLFRVQIDGKWYTGNGRYTFIGWREVHDLIGWLMAEAALPQEEEVPAIPYRSLVRVYMDDEWHSGTTVVPPHREVDGRWYQWVKLVDVRRPVRVPCHDVKFMRLR